MEVANGHVDLTGKVFDRLTVLFLSKTIPASHGNRFYYRCQCICGNLKDVRSDSLKDRSIRSCGCLHRDVFSATGRHYPIGKKFGRLTIIKELGTNSRGMVYSCKCRCGKQCKVSGQSLTSGVTKSCGCYYKETRKTVNYRHGKAPGPPSRKIPVYSAYQRARSSCRNPNNRHYSYYGGRGILFLFSNFKEFYAIVGDKPGDDFKLQRADKDGHYEESNVGWVRNKNAFKIRKKK